ncbi:hypothetical protein Tco_0982769, partial [Tanacetum coccineum]
GFTSLNLFLEETNTFDNSLTESFCFDLEENSSSSTTTHSDYSLPDYEAFYSDDDHIREKSSGSTTTHTDFSQYDSFIFELSINPLPPADRSDFYHEEFADELAHIISPPEYDCFCFKNEPERGDFTMDVVNDIFPTGEPRVHVPNILPTHPTLHLDTDFILLSEPLFAYIVWIFLPFLTYPVAPPYLLSCGNEDTIFDPGISIYHSFMPGHGNVLVWGLLEMDIRQKEEKSSKNDKTEYEMEKRGKAKVKSKPMSKKVKVKVKVNPEKCSLKTTINFSKDEPFSGSTINHSDTLPPSSSPVKTSDNLEEFADELTLLDSFPPDNDDSILKKAVHEENFQVYSNHLFEFDDNFTSSNVNPLFNEMEEDVENKNSNVSNSDEPVLLNTPLTDKVECFDPEDDVDEIDAFLAMEVSSDFEEGYYDSEGDVIFLENLLSDDTTHNLSPKVIFDETDHYTSISFSPRSDPLHHEFAGEIITLPSRNVREHEEYLNLMTLLCEISTSQSPENLPASPIPVEDSDPVQEEIIIFLVSDDVIPPGVENDDSEDEDNSTSLPEHESPNLDHQDNPSVPRPPPEPPNVKICLEPDTAMKNDFIFLPFFTYPEDSPFILSLGSEDLVFDPGISTFHLSLKPVPFALPKDE